MDATYPICVLKVNIGCCSSCVDRVTKLLLKIHGVHEVLADPEKCLVTVTGTAEVLTLIKQIGKKIHRKASVVSYTDPSNNDKKDDNKKKNKKKNDSGNMKEEHNHHHHHHSSGHRCEDEDNVPPQHHCSGHRCEDEDNVPPKQQEHYHNFRNPHCRDHQNNPFPYPGHNTPVIGVPPHAHPNPGHNIPIIRVPPRVHPEPPFPQRSRFTKDMNLPHSQPSPPLQPHLDAHYPPSRRPYHAIPPPSSHPHLDSSSHYPPRMPPPSSHPHLDSSSHYPPQMPPLNSHYNQHYGDDLDYDRHRMNIRVLPPQCDDPYCTCSSMLPRSPPFYGGFGPRPPPPPPYYGGPTHPVARQVPPDGNNFMQYFSDENTSSGCCIL